MTWVSQHAGGGWRTVCGVNPLLPPSQVPGLKLRSPVCSPGFHPLSHLSGPILFYFNKDFNFLRPLQKRHMVILYDLFIPRQAWKIGFIGFFPPESRAERSKSHAASGWVQGTHSEQALYPRALRCTCGWTSKPGFKILLTGILSGRNQEIAS